MTPAQRAELNRGGAAMQGAVLACLMGLASACTGANTSAVVQAAQAAKTDALPLQPHLWTVRCEAASGQHCAGDPVLSFPEGSEYCRHDYQITEGPFGDTFQRVSVDRSGSLKVQVRAAGGPLWDPYASRIGLKIRGWGIPRELGRAQREALQCERADLSP